MEITPGGCAGSWAAMVKVRHSLASPPPTARLEAFLYPARGMSASDLFEARNALAGFAIVNPVRFTILAVLPLIWVYLFIDKAVRYRVCFFICRYCLMLLIQTDEYRVMSTSGSEMAASPQRPNWSANGHLRWTLSKGDFKPDDKRSCLLSSPNTLISWVRPLN